MQSVQQCCSDTEGQLVHMAQPRCLQHDIHIACYKLRMCTVCEWHCNEPLARAKVNTKALQPTVTAQPITTTMRVRLLQCADKAHIAEVDGLAAFVSSPLWSVVSAQWQQQWYQLVVVLVNLNLYCGSEFVNVLSTAST
eukprot:4044-Heterococcus_DN1.PRE.1